jgi:hypothetical protein
MGISFSWPWKAVQHMAYLSATARCILLEEVFSLTQSSKPQARQPDFKRTLYFHRYRYISPFEPRVITCSLVLYQKVGKSYRYYEPFLVTASKPCSLSDPCAGGHYINFGQPVKSMDLVDLIIQSIRSQVVSLHYFYEF